MHFRTATPEDFSSIKNLYKDVSFLKNNLNLLEDEITDEYVNNFVTKSLSHGLIIVADNPELPGSLIGEIHAYTNGIKTFNHILTDFNIVIHPTFQGRKLGRTIFTIFLEEIAKNKPEIGKVELMVRENNEKAINLFRSLGFRIEGRMEMRIKTSEGLYEADIPMGWQNPNFEF